VPAWHAAFAAAAAAGDPYYLHCPACDAATLPPRRVCPACGGASLTVRPLSPDATVVTHTQIHVAAPAMRDDTPYTVAIAEFDEGVRLTGRLVDADDVAIGDAVELGARPRADDRLVLTFTPAD